MPPFKGLNKLQLELLAYEADKWRFFAKKTSLPSLDDYDGSNLDDWDSYDWEFGPRRRDYDDTWVDRDEEWYERGFQIFSDDDDGG